MTMFMLCGFIAPVCAGEKIAIPVSEKINISVCFYNIPPKLLYLNSKDIEQIEKFNIQTTKKEPFVHMEVCNYEIENKNENESRDIDIHIPFKDIHIPFKYFVKDSENYKSLGSQLFSFSRTVNEDVVEFTINFGSAIAELYYPKNQIKFFCNHPNFYEKDTEELLAAGIIRSDKNGKIFHGPKGYFRPEELLNQTPNVNICPQKKSAVIPSRSFFSFKNLCRISIPIIVLYALYKKFYKDMII